MATNHSRCIAGDTAAITFDIITQTGFVPVRVGTPAQSGSIGPGIVLFPSLLGLFSPQGANKHSTRDRSPSDAVNRPAWRVR